MKKIALLSAAALMSLVAAMPAKAQDKVEGSISADFVSDYVWRGQHCGNVSIQPSLGIAYKGFSLGAWGSVGIESTDDKELDLTLAYSTGGFHIGVTDYWFTGEKYFKYKAHETSHVWEANIGYDFGVFSLDWYTNFAGDDYKITDDLEVKHAYSSYFEANAPFKLGGLDWNATLGIVPYASSDCYGYVDKFAVTNIALKATKDLKITDSFTVPVFAQVAANPESQDAYFVVGFTLQP